MADDADIPIPWGGISDGTTAKPTLTLTAASLFAKRTQRDGYSTMISSVKIQPPGRPL